MLGSYFNRSFLVTLVLFAASFLHGCSFDVEIVKSCGIEHPNSLWGQFLCQRKEERRVEELRESARKAREIEARNQCVTNFFDVEFESKAKSIHDLVKKNFNKDSKFIKTAITSEFGITGDIEYSAKDRSGLATKSVDFIYPSKCDVKHVAGVATISHDDEVGLLALKFYQEWIGNDNTKKRKEIKKHALPKSGYHLQNMKKLGKHSYLTKILENKLGFYDRLEGCFYLSKQDLINQKNLIQKSKHRPDELPEDENYCLSIDNFHVRDQGISTELNVILTGRHVGESAGRQFPGVISAHSYTARPAGPEEKYHSIHLMGEFHDAPTNWKPIILSNSEPIGWESRRNYCAQGCSDILAFLVPHKNKYWSTEFFASSWDGAADHDINNYKINYEFITKPESIGHFPLKLLLSGLKDGSPIDSSATINFNPVENTYILPKNFFPRRQN